MKSVRKQNILNTFCKYASHESSAFEFFAPSPYLIEVCGGCGASDLCSKIWNYPLVYPSNCHVIIILCDVGGGLH